MTGLSDDLSAVIQVEMDNGRDICLGIAGLAVVHPVFVAITTAGLCGPASVLRDHLAAALEDRLIASTAGAARPPSMPCGGMTSLPRCHALNVASCKKLLVLVSDGRPIPAHAAHTWPDDILVLYPATANAANVLSPQLAHLNARSFTSSPAECVVDVLTAVGVDSDRRVFLSYRRRETQNLADQLFDALGRSGFDVFEDRFRIPPAVDFQKRLTEELADKSMVVALESAELLESEWARYEITFARQYDLGLFVLQLPGVPAHRQIQDLDTDQREILAAADFDLTAPGTLTAAALARVLQRIGDSERRARAERLRKLRTWIGYELGLRGVPHQLHSSGLLSCTAGGAQYLIWPSPRPARPHDFFLTDTADPAVRARRRILVAPNTHVHGDRRELLQWLERRSSVGFFDPSELSRLVNSVASGIL